MDGGRGREALYVCLPTVIEDSYIRLKKDVLGLIDRLQCGQSLSQNNGRERALKRDKAAFVPLAPSFRAMSHMSHDSSGTVPMCLRD